MRGEVSIELEICAPAKDVWATISSHKTPSLIFRLLPNMFQKLEIVKGEGGPGSVLHIVLSQGEPREWIEEFVKIDDEKREKRVRMIEGGFLDLGFSFYEVVFDIVEKDECSCTYKSAIVFEADDDKFPAAASLVSAASAWEIPRAIADYVVQNKATHNM